MFLNAPRAVGSLSLVLTSISLSSACSTKDGATSGDPASVTGGSSTTRTGAGGSAQGGSSANGGTSIGGTSDGGVQSSGGTANTGAGTGSPTGGTRASGQSGGNGGSSTPKTGSGGRTLMGGSASGTNTELAVTGGNKNTGGTSTSTAGTRTSTGGAGGSGTHTSVQVLGGSGSGGSTTSGGTPAGGASSNKTGAGGTTPGGSTQNAGGTLNNNTGGTGAAGAATSIGGTGGAGASTGTSQFTIGKCTIGAGTQEGSGETDERYLGVDVKRDNVNYRMITNGWGTGWKSHDIAWLGTSVSIKDYQGSRQSNGAPAGFPTVFCGKYSDTSLACGLPRALTDITALNTAVSWTHQAADGKYNASYDVWLGDGAAAFRGLQSYFMVWLHDPVDEQPAGSLTTEGVTVANVPGKWNIITGTVNNLPIVNYVRAEGDDTHQIAFNMMDFIRDAQTRKFNMPGKDVLAVAFGFEIWSGPVTNLSLDDFCLDIQ